MEISRNYNLFVCYKGIERSVGAKMAFSSIQIPSGHFEGGADRLNRMYLYDVGIEIPLRAFVTLISDPSDSPDAKDAAYEALATMQKLIQYNRIEAVQIVDTDTIKARLYGLHVNPDDFFQHKD